MRTMTRLRGLLVTLCCLCLIAALTMTAIAADPATNGTLKTVTTYHPNGQIAAITPMYDIGIGATRPPAGKYHGLMTAWDAEGRITQATNWYRDTWEWNRSYDWNQRIVRESRTDYTGTVRMSSRPMTQIELEYRNPNHRPSNLPTGTRYAVNVELREPSFGSPPWGESPNL